MSAPVSRFQVFISSTKKDLSEAREAVTWEALKLGFIPVGMENFSATGDRGWKTIQKTIDLSDYYVVIVAGRYGSIDPETKKSWTEREYEYALDKGLKVLAFVRDWASIWGTDIDEDRRHVDELRAQLEKAHLIETWTTTDDLRARVSTALSKAVQEDSAEEKLPPGWYRGPAPDLREFSRLSEEARELRVRLATVPSASKALELLRKIPVDASVSARWSMYSGGYNNGEFKFIGLDEDNNIIKLRPQDQGNAVRHLPLDKVDTVFPVGNGTWRLTLNAWQ
jgi:hypothetical protein